MTNEQRQAIMYLKNFFKAKTVGELNLRLDKLAMIVRKESNKEVVNGKYKSEFSAEIPFEAEQLLNKDGNKEPI